jgi:hypothetical protein
MMSSLKPSLSSTRIWPCDNIAVSGSASLAQVASYLVLESGAHTGGREGFCGTCAFPAMLHNYRVSTATVTAPHLPQDIPERN